MATNMLTAYDIVKAGTEGQQDRMALDDAAMRAAAFGDSFQAQKIQNRLFVMDAQRKEKAMQGDQVMTNWLMGLNANTSTPAQQRPSAPQAGPAGPVNAMTQPQPQGLPSPQTLPVNQLMQRMTPPPSPGTAPQQNPIAGEASAASTMPSAPEERTLQSFLAKVPNDIKKRYPEQALAWANSQVEYYDKIDKQRETMFKDYVSPFAKSAMETGNNDLFQATLNAGLNSGIPDIAKMSQALKDSSIQITGKAEVKSQPLMSDAVRSHLLQQTTDPLQQETINSIKNGERIEIIQKQGKIIEIKPVKDIDANSKTPYQQARDLVKEELAAKRLKREPTEKEIAKKQLEMTKEKTQVVVQIKGQEHDRQQKEKASNNNYKMSDRENSALNSAIADGRLNAEKVNSRSAKILAGLFLANPNLDMQNSAATSAAQKKVEQQRSAMQPFEIKANRMFDRVEAAYKKNPQGTIKILNQLKTDFNTKFTGDPATVILGRQIRTAMIEYAKVVNGSTGSAAVTDSARAEVETLLGQADRPETFYGSIKNERLAMKDAMSGYKETIDQLKAGGRGGNERKPSAAGGHKLPAGAQTGAYKGQRAYTIDGGKTFFSESDGRRIR